MVEMELPLRTEVVVDYRALHQLMRQHPRVLVVMEEKDYAKVQASARRYGWRLSKHERGWVIEHSGARGTAKTVTQAYAI